MKKIYSTPDAKVITIQTAQMIAESLGVNATLKDGSTVNAGSALSRDGGSSWDDDEE